MGEYSSAIAARLPAIGARIGRRVAEIDPRPAFGLVRRAEGGLIRADGLFMRVGEVADLFDAGGAIVGRAQCVGIDGDCVTLAPFGSLDGLTNRTTVAPTGAPPGLDVGPEYLGALVDPFGQVLDRYCDTREFDFQPERLPLDGAPPPSTSRRPIVRPIATGIRALDGFATVGYGQRVGVFGKPGAGKSTLIGQIVTFAKADVVVVGLVGERGREIVDFIDLLRKSDVSSRSCVVGSTSDRSPQERLAGAFAATTVAEYFRNRGLNVLLVIDSITRVARAARELGLAAGEPPTRRGYPPSVFTLLPRLFERAGAVEAGSITAFYSVLAEGLLETDPIVEETKSLLDGHIILSPKLLAAGRRPPVDIVESLSRSASRLMSPEHERAARKVRAMLTRCADVELLVRIGEYQRGADAEIDHALEMRPEIEDFLAQGSATTEFDETVREVMRLSQ